MAFRTPCAEGRLAGEAVSADDKAHGIGRLLSRLGARRTGGYSENGSCAGVPETLVPVSAMPTKALRKFILTLRSRSTPAVLDIGPVVGQNVAFFGEQLGCKIYIENIFADLDRHARDGRLDSFASFLEQRFKQGDESIDGILCWDLLDYLPRPAATVLAGQLMRMLRIDGVLLGFFSTTSLDVPYFTKYAIVDETSLEHRPYPGPLVRNGALANRDIIKLFEGLRVSDSFLLQTHCREILFRKPAYLASAR
ncbi:MAG: hypothetical protein ACE148_14670 [Vicinamibacterales bacterium]